MNYQTDFQEFIKFTNSQKEVSLAIAKNEEELKEFQEILEKYRFKQATKVPQLMLHSDSAAKLFFLVKEELPKDLYDFILQYPTGRVQIFDSNNMKSNITVPVYKDVSIVLLMTKETLSKIQEDNQFLENVGITYQS
ncbi:MAG: hypothetical protein C4584_00775 [Armatimonadetes bacterium]|nr:MAG: hypothetical protein C4584_00775 [Armatimonadota bacterium]